MTQKLFIALLALSTSALAAGAGGMIVSAFAQDAPLTVGYRGLLQDAGLPVNGPRTLVFSIHKGEPDADPFYCELHAVVLERGRFFVEIGAGEVDPECGGDLQSALRSTQALYLTVEVLNGQTRTPLDGAQRLTAVPYAHSALSNPGSVPIGTIIEWYPPNDSTPLPYGFVDADGEMVNDTESPIHGVPLPNLNGSLLRGAPTNGFGGSLEHTHSFDRPSHSHSFSTNDHTHGVPLSHNHTGSTVSGGAHTHTVTVGIQGDGDFDTNSLATHTVSSPTGSSGSHAHAVLTNGGTETSSAAGRDDSKSTSVASEQNNVVSSAESHLPRSFNLRYLIRIK